MNWDIVLAAVLAGGVAGPLTSLFLNWRTRNREKENWYRDKRFVTFAELLSTVSAYEPVDDLEHWPDRIQTLSQQVHLLSPEGKPPVTLRDAMQTVFGLALDRKLGKAEKDLYAWRGKMRGALHTLREELAKALEQ